LHLELPRRARGLTRLRVSIRAVGDDGVASAARTVELRQR
jgi:hypothetical protein